MSPIELIRESIATNDLPEELLASLDAAGYILVPKHPDEAMRDAGAQAEADAFGAVSTWISMTEASQEALKSLIEESQR